MNLKPAIAVLIGLSVSTVAFVSGRFSGTGTIATLEVQEPVGIDDAFTASMDRFRDVLEVLATNSAELAADREFVAVRIRYEVIYNRLGVSQAVRVRLDGDEQILKALEMIPAARDLALRTRTSGTDRRPQ